MGGRLRSEPAPCAGLRLPADEANLVIGIDLQSIQDRRQVIKDFPALSPPATSTVRSPRGQFMKVVNLAAFFFAGPVPFMAGNCY
jgi:hypothetical protein